MVFTVVLLIINETCKKNAYTTVKSKETTTYKQLQNRTLQLPIGRGQGHHLQGSGWSAAHVVAWPWSQDVQGADYVPLVGT